MKKLIIIGASSLALTACLASETPTPQAPTSETSSTAPAGNTATAGALKSADINVRLDAWFEQKFMENARAYPQILAQLGIKQRTDEWNDPSRAFALEQLDIARQNLDELKSNFNPDDLDDDHRLSYRLFVKGVEDRLEGVKWWDHNYPFNQMFGAHSQVPPFLINQHRIDNADDARAYIARLNGIDSYMAEVIKNAENSAQKGIQPPTFVYDHVIDASRNIISGAPFDDGDYSILMNDFRKKVEKLNLSDTMREDLYAKAITALLNSVKPAYENVITTMQRQKAVSSSDDGVWKLPNGADFYAYRLQQMTTTDMSASDIHQLGLKEVARIQDEMRAIMKQVGYEGSLQDFFQYLQSDPRFTYEDSQAGREAYLTKATELIDIMKGELKTVFNRTPKADLIVKRVEPFREKAGSKAFYNRPAADGSRPGIYYANLYKIEDMPKYQMEALAYHEGIPGHHMQLAISQELEGVPKFRKFGRYTAYTEGWGLYSEYLPKEMGFYQDPYSDFGRLAMEIWRAARLVVDTGLHDKEWTREKAIDYLTENTPNPENDCRKAIERYIVMPGQATAYKVGMLKIQAERAKAEKALGDKFDIRGFHDVLLGSGPIPLDIFEENVDKWIAKEK